MTYIRIRIIPPIWFSGFLAIVFPPSVSSSNQMGFIREDPRRGRNLFRCFVIGEDIPIDHSMGRVPHVEPADSLREFSTQRLCHGPEQSNIRYRFP